MSTAPVRVVLDTNVVLDCLVFDDASTRPLLQAMLERRVIALTRPDCMQELERVLDYPQFGLDAPAQAAALERYCALVLEVNATGGAAPLPRCADRDDQKFLELARDGAAHYLLSKDKRVLELARRRSIRAPFQIAHPAAFVQSLVKHGE